MANKNKGCGSPLSNPFFPHYNCGDIEDLKHSDSIILCDDCKDREDSN